MATGAALNHVTFIVESQSIREYIDPFAYWGYSNSLGFDKKIRFPVSSSQSQSSLSYSNEEPNLRALGLQADSGSVIQLQVR